MYIKIKRIIDLVLSALAIIILSPVLLVISIIIKLSSPGPALFKQKRVGKNKEYFYILKFRTMRIDTPSETPTHLLQDPNKYITKIGKFLRKTSLDELPQIFNIFKGEMSIIGPRPALWNQYDLIEARDVYAINNVLPGLTGWAQINGRDELNIIDKVAFDKEYVNKLSCSMDVAIFFMSIKQVICSRNIVEGAISSENVNTEEI